MPIQTNLSVGPYFDDFDETKNYHQVLFKPGVALQTRELNVLQTMLQNQIERFGDNIFTKGTIISGCNFQYFNNYPYVKFLDLQNDGSPVVIQNYIGLFVKAASSNLVAYILGANSGYVNQAPNLNTLFVRYLNSGASGTATAFSPSDVLTLYNSNNSLYQVNVGVGGTGAGYSNSDTVVFLPAMVINNTFSVAVNSTITDAVSGARAVISSINTTAVANSLVVSVRPYANDMANSSITTNTNWTFNVGNTVTVANGSGSHGATITQIIGAGASGIPLTDVNGKIQYVTLTQGGTGYFVSPYVAIKTSNNSADTSAILVNYPNVPTILAQNYKCQLTVASTLVSGSSPPVGTGYAFGVSQGVIYQKGYFLYVNPQTVVVSQYSNLPDQLVVGFNTSETIINSNIDQTLLDNATGTYNSLAPGADRLQLNPSLVVLNAASAAANTLFFPITAFSNGQPYLQNQHTSYASINDEMARRTYNTSGDFVTDPFNLSTAVASLDSSTNATTQSLYFNAVVDPGAGYISGYSVNTFSNYYLKCRQGTDTVVANGLNVATTYGNYITVQEIGGVFTFTTGDIVTIYDSAKQFLTNSTNYYTGNTTPVGNAIGTARIRSFVPVSGTPGTPAYTSKLYLFDVNMYPGQNFLKAKSVYYSNNSLTGVADIILQNTASLGYVAQITNAASSQMVFPIGTSSVSATANHAFTYNSILNTTSGVTVNTTSGVITAQLGAQTFPFTAGLALTNSQLSQITVLFHAANAQANSNTTVVLTTSSASNIATVTAGTANSLVVGTYLKIFSNTAGEVRRVTAIANATAIQLDTAPSQSNTGSNTVVFYPQNVPINIPSANLAANGSLLTIPLGAAVNTSVANATIITPVSVTGQTVSNKLSKRDTTVVLNMSNNIVGNSGPWALGHPDIYRLKKVYKDVNTNIISAGTVVTANVANPVSIPSTWVDVTNQFYIDHKQGVDFYDIGYLKKTPSSSLKIGTNEALVVQFDHFTSSGGSFFTRQSYPVNDTQPYSVVTSTGSANVNTLEIPEMFDNQGSYYDMIEMVDFRVRVANTANVTAANTQNSTVNPVDLGALSPVLASGTTLSSNITITGISTGTSGIYVGMAVISNNGSIPNGSKVVAVVNSSAVNISSTATSGTTAGLTFNGDAAKFGTLSNNQFPLDGSIFTSDVTHYLGRVDRVVVDKLGNIKDFEGVPAATNIVPASEQANTLTVNLLFIPPYPSIPLQMDTNYVSLIDKKIASQTNTFKRVTNHSISVPTSTGTGITKNQPVVYTMQDIAHLENRISALEYNSTLNLLEQSISSVTIPSNINSLVNRFKYGFFADAFINSSYSDVTNPEYSAKIMNNEIVANQIVNNIELNFNFNDTTTNNAVTGSYLTLPYTESVLTSQLIATNGAIYIPPPPPTTYTGVMTANPPTFTLATNVQGSLSATPNATKKTWYRSIPHNQWNSFMKTYNIWTGYETDIVTNLYETALVFNQSGTYTFQLTADDNGAVYVDGVLIGTCSYNLVYTFNPTITSGTHIVTLVGQNTQPANAGIGLLITTPNGTVMWSTLNAIG